VSSRATATHGVWGAMGRFGSVVASLITFVSPSITAAQTTPRIETLPALSDSYVTLRTARSQIAAPTTTAARMKWRVRKFLDGRGSASAPSQPSLPPTRPGALDFGPVGFC
jgi:hypothetical protein